MYKDKELNQMRTILCAIEARVIHMKGAIDIIQNATEKTELQSRLEEFAVNSYGIKHQGSALEDIAQKYARHRSIELLTYMNRKYMS